MNIGTYIVKFTTFFVSVILLSGIYARGEEYPATKENDKKEIKAAAKWADDIIKAKGFKLAFWPGTDFIELKRAYELNPAMWDVVFNTIAKAGKDLVGFEPTNKERLYGDGDDCYMIFQEYTPKTADKIRSEKHEKYIDVQISTGNVVWGIDNEEGAELTVPFNSARDIAFYSAKTAKMIKQKASKPYIFIFFPKDLHIPSYSRESKPTKEWKLIIKVNSK